MTTRWPGSPGLRVLTAQVAAVSDAREVRSRVAAEVVQVLAEEPSASRTGIELALSLSLPMARHRVGPVGLIDALRLLRETVLEVSGLDPDCEPIPLAAGEPRVAAVAVAVYVAELLGRAARATGTERATIARSVTARLTDR